MKILNIILSILLLICSVTAIVGWEAYRGTNNNLQVSYNDNQLLKTENSKLLDDNSVLIQKVNLKSFANEKELQKFLTNDDTDIKFATSEYNSEACINLMKNARESGFWMGICPVNTTDENVLTATLNRIRGAYDGSWNIYAMTIVGDNQIYLIDPSEDTRWFKVVTFGADFQEYSTPKVKSNIN